MKDIINSPKNKWVYPKQVMKEYQEMLDMAEIKALSKYSLEHPLNDKQFKRMMELKNKLFKGKIK